jgi:hypothetical protein
MSMDERAVLLVTAKHELRVELQIAQMDFGFLSSYPCHLRHLRINFDWRCASAHWRPLPGLLHRSRDSQ